MAPACEPLCHFGGRLFFTSFPHPPPRSDVLNRVPNEPENRPQVRGQTQAGTSTTPDDDAQYYYFTIDDQLLYMSFFQDWGPLNLAMVYKACILIHELLQDEDLKDYGLVLYSSNDPRRKANAALLMSLYVLIVLHRPPWEAFHPIAEMEFMPFRDAGRGRSDFNLNIQDCLWGIYKAMQNNLCDMNQFDVEDYEYYEKVENGDWNWITPNFIAFASPVDPIWIKREKEKRAQESQPGGPSSPAKSETALQRKLSTPFLNCLDYFEKRNVKLVVRLNNQLYDRQVFLDQGVNHVELYFDDGSNPSDEIVRQFIELADQVVEMKGVVAVHCKAGLGRTGTLIGAYLIWKYGFTASEAIAFMRIVRPGSVVGPQQQYMYVKQLEWAKWAAVDEMKRQRREEARMTSITEVAVSQTIVTPATPPAENDEEETIQLTTTTTTASSVTVPSTPPPMAMPPVTPSRHVAAAAAHTRELAPPGQPRKTPAAKRSSLAMEESDEEVEKDDVLPALALAPPVRRTKAKPASTRATSSRATASERPVRVLRSTTAASKRNDPALSNPAPNATSRVTKPNGQLPNKIPRLANETTARATASQRPRQPTIQQPSRLPTLIPTRRTNRHAAASVQETPVAIAAVVKAAQAADWMTNNASAVVKPGSKSERPNLRPIRRRRSSFSAADVVA